MPASDYPKLQKPANPAVRVRDIAFVKFTRTNLDKSERFMADFGLKTVAKTHEQLLMAAAGGYGPCYIAERGRKNAFAGIGLAVKSESDLQTLAALPGSGAVSPAYSDGAQCVELKDPTGMSVWAVHGAHTKPAPSRAPLGQNTPASSARVNDMLRPAAQPSEVLRLGHAVLGRVEFCENANWYINTFGFIPTDVQTIEGGRPIIAFLRCDRGDEPADHHSLVVAQHIADDYNHSAYETLDLDDIAMGQEFLASRGYTHAWGIGRHTLGSQIFDYWRDPCGDRFEHYCDSDKFTAAHATQYSEFTDLGSTYQWGSPPPRDFEGKPSLALIFRAVRAAMKSSSLNFGVLRRLARIGGSKPRPWL